MSRVFISYSSKSKNLVAALAEDVETANHQIWFDHKLTGGQAWWEQILENIRQCDLFIFALTPEALASYPCQLEYKYAYQLKKNILPVLVADGVSANLLPPELSVIQFVDYRSQDKQAAFMLMNALNNLSAPQPLPDPLPEPPAVPISYLGNLKEQVETAKPLNFEEQTALVFKLRERLREGDNSEDVLSLLRQMKRRDDLFANIEREIDAVINSAALAQPSEKNIDMRSKFRPKVEEIIRSIQATERTAERISITATQRWIWGGSSALMWGFIFWYYADQRSSLGTVGEALVIITPIFIQVIAFRRLLVPVILSLKWWQMLAVAVAWGISLSLALFIGSSGFIYDLHGLTLPQWGLTGVIFGFLGGMLTPEVITRLRRSQ